MLDIMMIADVHALGIEGSPIPFDPRGQYIVAVRKLDHAREVASMNADREPSHARTAL
jgi:hypothetical protein